jgi:type I restriction enzyme S subunit
MPKQWPQVALGEILTERNETPDPALVRAGDIPIISKIRFSDGGIELRTDSDTNTKMILIHPGDLVLSGINAMKGAIAIYLPETSQRAAATIHYAAYHVNKERADIHYLWWLLRSQYFQDILSQQVPQGIKTELKAKRLLPVVIPLPALFEQQQIVAQINKYASMVFEIEGLHHSSSEIVESALISELHHFFSRADHFRQVPLREVAQFQRGRFSHRPRNDSRFYGGDYPFIQINDLPKDGKFITSFSQTLNELGLLTSKMFPAKTLVISIAATIGAVGILQFDSCMPDSLVGINALNGEALNEYLYYFFLYQQEYLSSIAPQVAQKNINIRILDQLVVPLPSIEKQKELTLRFFEIETRISSIKKIQREMQNELSALMPAILDRAIQGK